MRPIILTIPHASLAIPEELRGNVLLTSDDLIRYSDLYTDRIFAVPETHIIPYVFSRVFIDVNRAPDDISREYARREEGVIVHATWDGKMIYRDEPSETVMQELIRNSHDAYHEEIDAHIPDARFLIDCHSYMPVGPIFKIDAGKSRPDVCLGNMNYTTCTREHTVFFREFFERHGFTVSINFPYQGKYILGRHCHRRRIPHFLVPGIQIELNQKLYSNPVTCAPNEEAIVQLNSLIAKVVGEFCLLSVFLLFASLAPNLALAKSEKLYENWQFKTEEDLRAWDYTGFNEARITSEGISFAVSEKATMYRDLPERFRDNVDALRIEYDATGLSEMKVLFLTLRENGDIAQRFSLRYAVTEGGKNVQYIPLDYYRSHVKNAEVFALVFLGTADSVTFDGVRFLHYSPWEKLLGAWRGFWSLERFEPFTINILHGSSIVFDGGPFMDEPGWRTISRSANAYLLLGLILWGIALLFSRLALPRFRRISWDDARGKILSLFFIGVLLVWVFMDFRMGLEFIRNVARDHVQYVVAAPEKKVFRDVGDFYAFIDFAKPFLKDRGTYEVLLKERWPYFGMIQYETYPSRPNPNEPMSDLWVIYDRPDIMADSEGRLSHLGDPFTEPGRLLGRFSDDSFIFRASAPSQ